MNQPENSISEVEFFKSKHTFVLDFRTVPEVDVVYTGRHLLGTQSGLLVEIKKTATTKDLKAYIFCVADATAYITNGHAEVTMAK